MKRTVIVHFRARSYESGDRRWEVSACYHPSGRIALSPDWAQVTCKNCLKSKPREAT